MSRTRSSMVLLGICILALLIGLLRVASQQTPLPTGSSYSALPNGAQALYEWAASVGGTPERMQTTDLRRDEIPATLVVLQPETIFSRTEQTAFDLVPLGGGKLVVAGDSLGWLLYVRSLGITVDPIPNGASSATTPDGALTVRVVFRYRLQAAYATPLLVTADGSWVGLRMPYKEGSLVVLASPEPLLNQTLRNNQVARFVYREFVLPANGGVMAFDEAHHSFAPLASASPATVNQLLFDTAPGRAVLYAAGVTFLYLLLSGRRLGPPLAARPPAEMHRTMYEHVQMLAGLYRRAGHLGTVRAAFSKHFSREVARGTGSSPRRVAELSAALARVEAARSESDLIAAVASAQPEA